MGLSLRRKGALDKMISAGCGGREKVSRAEGIQQVLLGSSSDSGEYSEILVGGIRLLALFIDLRPQ